MTPMPTPIPRTGPNPPPSERRAHTTLAACRARFARAPSARLIALAWILAVGGRGFLATRPGGALGAADVLAVAVPLALQPVTEWVIHTYVLHFTPRKVGRFTIDLPAAREHRRHHRDPHSPETAFMPLADLATLIATATLLGALATGRVATTLSVLVAATTLMGVYEWTHFLVHTPYTPRSRYVKHLKRSHRLHHFRNEHYWMGVTVDLADRLLGTFPDPAGPMPVRTRRRNDPELR